MVTTKKTSFPSLHSDQGHGLTKVWSKRNKSQNYKRKKEGLNASKSLGERRWEEGGLLEEGFNSQSVDISPKIIFTPKYVRFVINCCESHLRTFCRQIHQSAKIGGRGGWAKLGNFKKNISGLSIYSSYHIWLCRSDPLFQEPPFLPPPFPDRLWGIEPLFSFYFVICCFSCCDQTLVKPCPWSECKLGKLVILVVTIGP